VADKEYPLEHGHDRATEVHNTAPGEVDGISFQAGVISGGVHFHDADSTRPSESAIRAVVPRQLLPAPSRFADRRDEWAELERVLGRPADATPPVVLLTGPGGVGKTALALRWLGQRADRFPGGQLYADLTSADGEPVAPDDILGQHLRALGVAAQHVPAEFAERRALFRSVTADRALAVLLDNAVSAAQVRVLVPASATSMVVVTSRRTLLGLLTAGAELIQVEPLDAEGALELLSHRVGADRIATENGPAVTLAELCGGLPIALCVVAALAVARPRRPLERTVADLREEQHRLDELSLDDETSVRGTFDMSCVDLSDDAARIYRTMGLNPGADFGLDLVAAATRQPAASARRAVNELVDASLLTERADGRFQFHDLIRAHARERAERTEPPDEVAAAVRRMVEWYLRVADAADAVVMPSRRRLSHGLAEAPLPAGLADYDGALAWLELERHNLTAMTRAASSHHWYELTNLLARAMQPLFILHRHYQDAVYIDEIGLRAATALADRRGEVDMRKRLARTYSRLGEFESAQTHVTELLRATRAWGDRRGEASALKSRGILLTETGRLDSAVAAFHEALAILTELDQRHAQGLTLINLGEALIALGRFDEAIGQLESARLLLSAPERTDSYNAARAALRQGQALALAGSPAAARELLGTTLATLTELRATAEQAMTHRALAELAQLSGDEPTAREHEAAAIHLARGTTSLIDDET
jgi:tetratricopeptide (TPR) repeat protein